MMVANDLRLEKLRQRRRQSAPKGKSSVGKVALLSLFPSQLHPCVCEQALDNTSTAGASAPSALLRMNIRIWQLHYDGKTAISRSSIERGARGCTGTTVHSLLRVVDLLVQSGL